MTAGAGIGGVCQAARGPLQAASRRDPRQEQGDNTPFSTACPPDSPEVSCKPEQGSGVGVSGALGVCSAERECVGEQELTTERIVAEADLNKQLGTLRYLRGLRAARQRMQAGAERAEQAPDKQKSEPAAGLFTISCHYLTCQMLALPGSLQPQLWDASEGLLVRGNNTAESPFKSRPSNPVGQGICKQSVLLGGCR